MYCSPILLAVCTVGNLTTATALQRLYLSVLSTAMYVFVSLLVDIIVLWSRCGIDWLRLVTNVDLRDKVMSSATALCKVCCFSSTVPAGHGWRISKVALLSTWLM